MKNKNPQDKMKRAFRLWKQYKTETREYREIAESLGIQTLELNHQCSQINQHRTGR